jgi:predicted dehydrogenase
MDQSIRVGVVGCGQIADAHLQEISKIEFARVVAVCDRHAVLAEQAAARFDVPRAYSRFDEMLSAEQIDVVHITTPATSHEALATQAMEDGVHVYLEKPFTTTVLEADRLFQVAQRCQKSLCVGHDQLFDPIWLRLIDCVEQGKIGEIVSVHTTLNYDMSGPYGLTISSNKNHWVNRLPGGLLQNVISHPLYRITDWMPDEYPDVIVSSRPMDTSRVIPRDMTVVLRGADVTGVLSFSTRSRPLSRFARISGTKGSVTVDLDAQTMRFDHPPRTRGPFAKLEVPCYQLREATTSLFRNAWRFARGELHYFSGMNRLFRDFYQSILDGGQPPIPHQEIRRVTRILDEIIEKKNADELRYQLVADQGPNPEITDQRRKNQFT